MSINGIPPQPNPRKRSAMTAQLPISGQPDQAGQMFRHHNQIMLAQMHPPPGGPAMARQVHVMDNQRHRLPPDMKRDTIPMHRPADQSNMGGGSVRKRRKKMKDPSAPKNPLSAYLFFVVKQRSDMSPSDSELSFSEMAKKIGRKWREMSKDEKAPYVQLADYDKKRYEREKEQYAQKMDGMTEQRTAANTSAAQVHNSSIPHNQAKAQYGMAPNNFTMGNEQFSQYHGTYPPQVQRAPFYSPAGHYSFPPRGNHPNAPTAAPPYGYMPSNPGPYHGYMGGPDPSTQGSRGGVNAGRTKQPSDNKTTPDSANSAQQYVPHNQGMENRPQPSMGMPPPSSTGMQPGAPPPPLGYPGGFGNSMQMILPQHHMTQMPPNPPRYDAASGGMLMPHAYGQIPPHGQMPAQGVPAPYPVMKGPNVHASTAAEMTSAISTTQMSGPTASLVNLAPEGAPDPARKFPGVETAQRGPPPSDEDPEQAAEKEEEPKPDKSEESKK